MASIQKILEAVTTLSTIQDEDKQSLLIHRKELESAINNLQDVLQSSNCTTQSAQGIAIPPRATLSDTTKQGHLNKLLPPDPSSPGLCGNTLEDLPHSVKAVLKTLSKRLQQIRTCTYRPEGLAIPNELTTEDPRVVDIFLVCGRRNLEDFFRAGLSALSLADDYADWAEAVAYPSRLDALSKDLDTKDGAHYLKYTKACSRFADPKRASVYIEYGIKYRFFERLCMIRSQGPTCNDVSTLPHRQLGFTSLLFFAWTSFYRCRYQDLPALASALLATEEFRKIAEKSNEEIELCLKAHKGKAARLFHY
ncbi:hypothetical protein P170DRAFT_95784 [Aspergillus steynii IBT 23096]|uniref:Uncharacterized protein n=1 Tax=Aspergillus steynii IBT 23096 TaxID=1392250 RepID=A0A2I2GGP2_9EURO|nr:uncharacterized protein P170DRAFT_95784 [Aspergillus steynii IBT 23096]PLB52051.1 hypothetical protein P170DRAFT_95784 [Aspergillus steynii IBT 23096]